MISCYQNTHSPNVLEEIDIYEYLERIKSPSESILSSILKTRGYYNKDKDQYDYLKSKLPCFTLNFSFKNRKCNENIKVPTGFIYLDLDGSTSFDYYNQYVFASWLSPSKNGRGILVKVEGLNLNNFKYTYIVIAQHLNINVDIRAAKATQYTVHSYDENIYFNENSITWLINNTSETKSSFTPTRSILKEKRKDRDIMGVNPTLRYNNYDNIDYKGKKYLYFKNEKKLMATVIIPRIIKKGSRNSILSAIAYQMRALNIHISFAFLLSYIKSVNLYHCKPVLYDNEITTIVKNIMSKKNSHLY
ncbi:BT4734/BF3469 family protein [Tenacibaculum aquimarinum]|uniref:BT4734/BF3469 family protein n=1 Tax=Tenacibaculum aquimarinum TaxID=2910675 RepID=UPI001F0A2E2F|nr:BT4734/BF3469 family protein [Tenacibaculum aquimarinum]MCH3884402.1 hypothetical protein [Tenacibaculum aquimarinum]